MFKAESQSGYGTANIIASGKDCVKGQTLALHSAFLAVLHFDFAVESFGGGCW